MLEPKAETVKVRLVLKKAMGGVSQPCYCRRHNDQYGFLVRL